MNHLTSNTNSTLKQKRLVISLFGMLVLVICLLIVVGSLYLKKTDKTPTPQVVESSRPQATALPISVYQGYVKSVTLEEITLNMGNVVKNFTLSQDLKIIESTSSNSSLNFEGKTLKLSDVKVEKPVRILVNDKNQATSIFVLTDTSAVVASLAKSPLLLTDLQVEDISPTQITVKTNEKESKTFEISKQIIIQKVEKGVKQPVEANVSDIKKGGYVTLSVNRGTNQLEGIFIK